MLTVNYKLYSGPALGKNVIRKVRVWHFPFPLSVLLHLVIFRYGYSLFTGHIQVGGIDVRTEGFCWELSGRTILQ